MPFFEHISIGLRIAQPVGPLEPRAFSLPGFSICFRSGYIQVINTYGVSLALPLARRRFTIRRPLFVAILARNPWVRARFILLG